MVTVTFSTLYWLISVKLTRQSTSKKVWALELNSTTCLTKLLQDSGWSYRSTVLLVPEILLSSQKIFRQEENKFNNSDKRRYSEENSHHDLRNAIIMQPS